MVTPSKKETAISGQMCNFLLLLFYYKQKEKFNNNNNNNNNNINNNDLLTDPLGGSSLLNYIDYNYKINRIKLFTNYTVELQ